MATVIVAGADQRMLRRLAAAMQAAGRDCALLTNASLERGTGSGTAVCLYDLGQQPSANQRPLLAAIEANPLLQFVALTARPDASEGLQLLRAGARGYCNRLVSAALLGAVVAAVQQGEIWAGREVTTHLLDQATGERNDDPGSQPASLLAQLTPREAAVAKRVAAGESNKVIAVDNGITERTVKAHLHSIFRKLGVRNRVQLALALTQAGSEHPVRSSG